MNIVRITMVSLPLLVASSTAFADSEEKKRGATEPQAPIEETPAVPQQPAPAPAVGTTQTTAAYTERRDVAEHKAAEPEAARVGDRWSVEPLIGAGTNDFNFGIGGRAGYTFKTPLYIGGTFMWHAGDTNNTVFSNGFTETKSNFYYPAMEAGYDIGLGREKRFVVRPYGGAGVLLDRERVSVNGAAAKDTQSAFMLYPGVTAHYRIPDGPLYVGADTRVLIPFENKGASYQAFFVTGLSM